MPDFTVAQNITTPIMLGALIAIALYGLYKMVISKIEVPPDKVEGFNTLNRVLRFLFWLALVLGALAIASHTITTVRAIETNAAKIEDLERNQAWQQRVFLPLAESGLMHLIDNRDFDEAERLVRVTRENFGAEARSWYLLGLLRYERGQHAAALTAFEEAAKTAGPEDRFANRYRLNQSGMLNRLGRYDEARRIVEPLLAQDPNDRFYRLNAIIAYTFGNPRQLSLGGEMTERFAGELVLGSPVGGRCRPVEPSNVEMTVYVLLHSFAISALLHIEDSKSEPRWPVLACACDINPAPVLAFLSNQSAHFRNVSLDPVLRVFADLKAKTDPSLQIANVHQRCA
ncbi:tetratricopeptide repeat protein [Belnapia rosea]|uniref:Uncharacterized protein n=1 Tax=Belnapia rosea TaxID=938405 RepID=A0A1G6RJC8_9PROT|nr:tetratricopeptide repeat protein [Belnapia rosea]SDD04513.1 hypothetical protein SAMN04487779_100428 [Belnapia rosea]